MDEQIRREKATFEACIRMARAGTQVKNRTMRVQAAERLAVLEAAYAARFPATQA